MNARDIAIRRLDSQQLDHTRLETPGEVVAWLGAAQAQDYAGAKWTVGLRLPAASDAGIEQAIVDKTILRTWALRGTLHFVAAADIRWLLALVGPRIIAGYARRYRELGLDERTLARSNAVLVKALQGGKAIARKKLRVILEESGISTEGQRAVHMLQRASLEGLICQGVAIRNDPTFLSLDGLAQKAGTTLALTREQAAAELARRYFASRGPATLQDFVWWSGLAVAEARAALDAVASQFVHEQVEGQTYWRSRAAPRARTGSPSVYLLPGFDEYLLSYRDRSASLEADIAAKMKPMNGMLSPTIAVDGRVVGTWKRTFQKGGVVIAANPFIRLTAAQDRALAAAAKRYGDFFGMPAVLA